MVVCAAALWPAPDGEEVMQSKRCDDLMYEEHAKNICYAELQAMPATVFAAIECLLAW